MAKLLFKTSILSNDIRTPHNIQGAAEALLGLYNAIRDAIWHYNYAVILPTVDDDYVCDKSQQRANMITFSGVHNDLCTYIDKAIAYQGLSQYQVVDLEWREYLSHNVRFYCRRYEYETAILTLEKYCAIFEQKIQKYLSSDYR